MSIYEMQEKLGAEATEADAEKCLAAGLDGTEENFLELAGEILED